eukprot:6389747-Prymnesium_polylepis.1
MPQTRPSCQPRPLPPARHPPAPPSSNTPTHPTSSPAQWHCPAQLSAYPTQNESIGTPLLVVRSRHLRAATCSPTECSSPPDSC